jgi:hypothetical protein
VARLLCGQRPTATFIDGSCRSSRGRWHPRGRTRSHRRAPSPFRTLRAGCGSRRGDPTSHRPCHRQPQSLCSALSSSRPPFEDRLLPPKSAASLLRRTANRLKGSGVASVMSAACGARLVRDSSERRIATRIAFSLPQPSHQSHASRIIWVRQCAGATDIHDL